MLSFDPTSNKKCINNPNLCPNGRHQLGLHVFY